MTPDIGITAQEILEKEEISFGHTAIPNPRLVKKLILSTEKSEDVLRNELANSEVISSRTNDQGLILNSTLKASTLERQIAEQFSRLIKTFPKNTTNKTLTAANKA